MEDELYGGELYDDAQLDFEADEAFEDHEALGLPGSPAQAKARNKEVPVAVKDVTSRSHGDAQEQVRDLQAQLKEAQALVEKWRGAFKEIAISVGVPIGRDPDAGAVVAAVQSLKLQGKSVQDEIKLMRKREAALQIQLAEKNMEAIELRRELNAVWQTSEPPLVQLKQLLLDPAVKREFLHLKGDLEETQNELKRVQTELEAVNFTQDSKIGRQLMAKVRALQEENEEMGRQLSEGKVHQLTAQLAMAKEYAEEMRKSFLELEDHCSLLDEEAEELQKEIFALRRQVREQELQLRPGRGPPPPRPLLDRKRLMPGDTDMGPPGRSFMARKRGR